MRGGAGVLSANRAWDSAMREVLDAALFVFPGGLRLGFQRPLHSDLKAQPGKPLAREGRSAQTCLVSGLRYRVLTRPSIVGLACLSYSKQTIRHRATCAALANQLGAWAPNDVPSTHKRSILRDLKSGGLLCSSTYRHRCQNLERADPFGPSSPSADASFGAQPENCSNSAGGEVNPGRRPLQLPVLVVPRLMTHRNGIIHPSITAIHHCWV
jgi:hypothetical protein